MVLIGDSMGTLEDLILALDESCGNMGLTIYQCKEDKDLDSVNIRLYGAPDKTCSSQWVS